MTVGKSRYFWDSRCYSLPLFSCQSYEFQPKLEIFSELSGVLILFFQIVRVHVYVRWTNLTTKPPFEIGKLRSFAYWSEFPSQYSWQEYPRIKSANTKNFTCKRGVRVTFSRLTWIMQKGHLYVTFRRAMSFQGSLMFSSLGTRSRDTQGTKLWPQGKLTDAFNVSFQNQMSGELLRKFKTGNRWQKLWVVFTNFCLFFYKTHEVWATDN